MDSGQRRVAENRFSDKWNAVLSSATAVTIKPGPLVLEPRCLRVCGGWNREKKLGQSESSHSALTTEKTANRPMQSLLVAGIEPIDAGPDQSDCAILICGLGSKARAAKYPRLFYRLKL